jgi:non-heme chloroperoxidase
MVRSEANPEGTPLEVFDGIRKSVRENRSQFYKDLTLPFFGYNRPGAEVSEGVREHFWLQGMAGSIKGHYDCIHEFSEVDYTEDLKRVSVPTLVIHGDDDQVVPIGAAGIKSSKIVKNAQLKVYPGAPHGLPITRADQLNEDLLAFIRQ